jgi:uncharacterized damage-inducible protein DinB
MSRLFVLLLLVATAGLAQQAANPFSSDALMRFERISKIVLAAAEKMPAESYDFKPTPEVFSFGQMAGHLADAQYTFCAPVKGVERPDVQIRKTKTAKAEIVAALNEAIGFCRPVYADMTDAKATETLKFFGGDFTRLSVLYYNVMHSFEHYGNMVTYLRMKGIVPPTSEPRPKK